MRVRAPNSSSAKREGMHYPKLLPTPQSCFADTRQKEYNAVLFLLLFCNRDTPDPCVGE